MDASLLRALLMLLASNVDAPSANPSIKSKAIRKTFVMFVRLSSDFRMHLWAPCMWVKENGEQRMNGRCVSAALKDDSANGKFFTPWVLV